ncbi:MAG: signal peptidase I [Patescibacteria group bacterium]|nr:signal peptidase I [Patescibacteria group bacterium]
MNIPDTEKQEPTEMDKMMNQDSRPASGGVLEFVGELIKITLIALAIIVPVRYFLVKPFYVNGASMEPTYYNREYLIIDEISYRFHVPQRGDVVVFKYPLDESQFFIKRIIGLPGERVSVRDESVTVYNEAHPEGIVLKEPYLGEDVVTTDTSDVALSEDEYFVMGDNRMASLDSRRFGALGRSEIIGRAWLRGWPFDRLGVLEHYSFSF